MNQQPRKHWCWLSLQISKRVCFWLKPSSSPRLTSQKKKKEIRRWRWLNQRERSTRVSDSYSRAPIRYSSKALGIPLVSISPSPMAPPLGFATVQIHTIRICFFFFFFFLSINFFFFFCFLPMNWFFYSSLFDRNWSDGGGGGGAGGAVGPAGVGVSPARRAVLRVSAA